MTMLSSTNPRKAQKLRERLIAKIDREATFIGNRFQEPRYMKVLTSIGNTRVRQFSSAVLEGQARLYFRLAFDAGVNTAREERDVFAD